MFYLLAIYINSKILIMKKAVDFEKSGGNYNFSSI
jgi:hypothetical protein